MKILNGLKALITRKQRFPMILITGSPKTGTTALYHSIKNALPPDSICQFEPENRQMALPENIKKPVLVKSFVPASSAYDFFNKKVLITRDPRDHLISTLLYRPYNLISRIDPEDTNRGEYIEEFLELLKKKEADPRSISVRELQELQDLWKIQHYGKKMIDYYRAHPGIFLFKYESYIDEELAELETYLGLRLNIASDVPQKRVIRSRAYGNWKDWFTPEDVAHYKMLFRDYMSEFGYNDSWELNPNPKLDPALGSGYVARIVEEARELADKRSLRESNKP